MIKPLHVELEELLDEVAPPLIDLAQLHRLVAIDDDPTTFDGECTAHAECQSII